jgi:L-ascorbate metabolism protein UlaG (beta-lactamase superfamily)
MIDGIHWLGHDTFRLEGSSVIYLDPFKLPSGAVPADVILVTHDHDHHLSRAAIAALVQPGTILIGPAPVVAAATAMNVEGLTLVTIAAGETLTAGTATVTAIPAYTTTKFRAPGVPYHPREAGGLGYLVELDGRTIYHAGDSDLIPEMRDVHCDVALLPIGGRSTMSADEAAAACDLIDAAVAVPMHYGDRAGDRSDAVRFAEESRIPVEILVLDHCG